MGSVQQERPSAYFSFHDQSISESKSTNLTEMEMTKILQGADSNAKIALLKTLICRISQGEHFPKILMSLMNCLTNENKVVKKLSMMVWEVVNRYDAQGKLLPEAILICNALKTNLEHPNEYIRGAALRCVSKLLDLEILDPILPAIILNLDHHHVYVRRHALLCIENIARSNDELRAYISHLDDKVESILNSEHNQTCRYHALLALIAINIDRAIGFFYSISNTLHIYPDTFVGGLIHLIQLTYQTHRKHVPMYTQALCILLTKLQPSAANINALPLQPSTLFTAGKTLLIISVAEQNIKIGLTTLVQLFLHDNNTALKSQILHHFTLFSQQQLYVNFLAPFMSDILSTLPLCNDFLRAMILDLAVRLCSHSNVESIVSSLRKEYLNVQDDLHNTQVQAAANTNPHKLLADHTPGVATSQQLIDGDITLRHQVAGSQQQQYRHNLFKTLHTISIQHPTVLSTIAPLLSLSIADPNPLTSLNAMKLTSEILLSNKTLRKNLLERLCEKYHQITIPEILRGVVWILGEFTGTDHLIIPAQSQHPHQYTPHPITQCDKNDINMLYSVANFLIHSMGLESFLPQQQLHEFCLREDANKQHDRDCQALQPQNDPVNFRFPHHLSLSRQLVYHGDTLFAAAYSTALTKVIVKIYHYHTHINPQPQTALETNSLYQQLHAMTVLIFTRILKFIPTLPAFEIPTAIAPVPPSNIHDAVTKFTPQQLHIQDTAEAPTIQHLAPELFTFFPEYAYLGLGHDAFERISMNLKLVLYPQQFAYNSDNELIFSSSVLALQQALQYEKQQSKEIKSRHKSDDNALLSNDSQHSSQSTSTTATTTTTAAAAVAQSPLLQQHKKIHNPIGIRLLRKNCEDTTYQDNVNFLTYLEDMNLALTGSKSGGSGGGTSQGQSISTPTTAIALNPASFTNPKSRPTIYQLTGLSDLVYCEVKVSINMYDVILEFTTINQSLTTLQNVSLELQCSNDLTLATPPPTFSLAPKNAVTNDPSGNRSQHRCVLRFNVNNTETGLICGNIVCDTSSGNNKHIIALQPIVIGISQYLTPSSCLPTDYRSMWSEFEWENKVLIATNITNPVQFIYHITELTNMHCLTPLDVFTNKANQIASTEPDDPTTAVSSSSSSAESVPEFIAANLYAISSFGEQALLNISVECVNGRLTGYLRVRAKTHGVARSLGDLVKTKQRV